MKKVIKNKPWQNFYGEVKSTLEYSDLSISLEFEKTAEKYPDYIAYEFMGKNTTYKEAIFAVKEFAKSLKSIGVSENDKVTICLPNCPQAITAFYAVNMVGAVATMIHPLSSESEIRFYLADSESKVCIALDQFYDKFDKIKNQVDLRKLIIASIKDSLPGAKAIGYALTQGRKIKKPPKSNDILLWKDFLAMGKGEENYIVKRKNVDPAVILYSGGTTGTSKGILLSNLNFNALSAQIEEMSNCFKPGNIMLAVMPMFHGFGLGVSIHSMLTNGAKCILVPKFTAATYGELIKKCRPNYIAGVPTLFEALLRSNILDGVDLSCLKGVFVGGDSLTIDLKKRIDQFLEEHNCSTKVREGYGTTECVTASCLTPYHIEKPGSIGIPLPDMYYKIVKVGTTKEVKAGAEGEICIAGPTVMLEYINQPEETAQTMQTHKDGMTWIHTGDLGTMDEDGFIYFKQRIKRMIVSSGYNIYPSVIENILDNNELINMSCIIGVKDPIKMQKVKAFVVLEKGILESEDVKEEIIDYAKKHIAKYAIPYEIEFRDSLPKTLVGKVNYRVLEEEEEQKEESK